MLVFLASAGFSFVFGCSSWYCISIACHLFFSLYHLRSFLRGIDSELHFFLSHNFITSYSLVFCFPFPVLVSKEKLLCAHYTFEWRNQAKTLGTPRIPNSILLNQYSALQTLSPIIKEARSYFDPGRQDA